MSELEQQIQSEVPLGNRGPTSNVSVSFEVDRRDKRGGGVACVCKCYRMLGLNVSSNI